jgi:hypothetical protein
MGFETFRNNDMRHLGTNIRPKFFDEGFGVWGKRFPVYGDV